MRVYIYVHICYSHKINVYCIYICIAVSHIDVIYTIYMRVYIYIYRSNLGWVQSNLHLALQWESFLCGANLWMAPAANFGSVPRKMDWGACCIGLGNEQGAQQASK